MDDRPPKEQKEISSQSEDKDPIYRKKLEPCKSFGEFALFVSFFPQLVAGPIVRASHFLPQLLVRAHANHRLPC